MPSLSPDPGLTAEPSLSAEPHLTHSDDDYGFKVDYPASFFVEDVTRPESIPGMVRALRFADERFRDGHPLGQVEIHVYVRDASTLVSWLNGHSAQGAEEETSSTYFRDPSGATQATVAGHDGLAFVSQAGEIGDIHTTIFFWRSVVMSIGWFSEQPDYHDEIRPVFESMVASFRE